MADSQTIGNYRGYSDLPKSALPIPHLWSVLSHGKNSFFFFPYFLHSNAKPISVSMQAFRQQRVGGFIIIVVPPPLSLTDLILWMNSAASVAAIHNLLSASSGSGELNSLLWNYPKIYLHWGYCYRILN